MHFFSLFTFMTLIHVLIILNWGHIELGSDHGERLTIKDVC